MTHTDQFVEQFRYWIDKRNLSFRELGRKAKVSHSTLSRVLSGKRQCGLGVATKLADAFQLWGVARDEFLQLAGSRFLKSTDSQKAGAENRRTSELFVSSLLKRLCEERIQVDKIVGGTTDAKGDIVLNMSDGSRTVIEVKTSK